MVKSGTEEAFRLLAPEMLGLIPGLFAQDEATCRPTLETFVSLLHHRPVLPEIRELVLAYNQRLPPHVREGLCSRVVDNDDVLHRLTVPVLVSHGLEDRMVLPESSRHIASVVPGAQVSLYPGIGHSALLGGCARVQPRAGRLRREVLVGRSDLGELQVGPIRPVGPM